MVDVVLNENLLLHRLKAAEQRTGFHFQANESLILARQLAARTVRDLVRVLVKPDAMACCSLGSLNGVAYRLTMADEDDGGDRVRIQRVLTEALDLVLGRGDWMMRLLTMRDLYPGLQLRRHPFYMEDGAVEPAWTVVSADYTAGFYVDVILERDGERIKAELIHLTMAEETKKEDEQHGV